MKKTLIALIAMVGAASAEITDGLQWAESVTGGLQKTSTFTINEYFDFSTPGVFVADAGNRAYSTNLGGKFTNAFTLSFKLIDFDANNWEDAVSLYSNGITHGTNNSIQVQKNSSGELMVYTENFSGSNVAGDASNINLGKLDNLEGKVLTLVFDGTGATKTLTAYVNGVANADTVTFTYADTVTPSTALTGFQFGTAFGGQRTANSVKLDDLALWSRALSAAEVATLVPEPTTATLSLLALCGLAARRRRK